MGDGVTNSNQESISNDELGDVNHKNQINGWAIKFTANKIKFSGIHL